MRHKLGLLELEHDGDEQLVKDLLEVDYKKQVDRCPAIVESGRCDKALRVLLQHSNEVLLVYMPTVQVLEGTSEDRWCGTLLLVSYILTRCRPHAVQTMYETGADFTNTFRWLAEIPLPTPSSAQSKSCIPQDGESSRGPDQDLTNKAEASSSGMLLT